MDIQTFRIEKKINNVPVILFPSVLKQEKKVYLIDCGYEETFDDFVHKLHNLSIQPGQITGIIISHDDIDHLGGLKHFKKRYPSVTLLCREIEEASVSGKIKSERLVQAENLLSSLPEDYISHGLWVSLSHSRTSPALL